MTTPSLTNIRFSFAAVMDNPETKSLFQQYLVESHNAEPFLFCEAVKQYMILHSDLNRYQSAQHIITDFIQKSSQHELNIDVKLRNSTTEKFAKATPTECPRTLFDDVQTIIFTELHQDC